MKYLLLLPLLFLFGCPGGHPIPEGLGDECIKAGKIPHYESTSAATSFTCTDPPPKKTF